MKIRGKDTEIIGIIRHIDKLGRISIPKEYRAFLKIKEDTRLSVLLTAENEIVIKRID